jgi:primosomal replication protein N
MYTQDINELTISGHVTKTPLLHDDLDELPACSFVLTHTTHAVDQGRSGWEQQHYNVLAYNRIAETFTDRHQAGQVVIVTGELDLQIKDTLIGPLPAITIIAHRIILIDGPLNPAASAAAPDTQVELAHTTIGPVPHTRAGW